MSNRKSDKEKKHHPSALLKRETCPGPISKWPITSKLIYMYKLAVALSDDPETKPSDFWNVLESLDPASTIRNQLDRAEVENTPKDLWKLFLSRYVAACVTGMAREMGILVALERSGLVVFPDKYNLKGNDDARQTSRKPDGTGYTDLLPSFTPVERDIPYFNGAFLGFLQTRLQKELASRGLLPAADGGELDLDDRITEAQKQLSVERLYGETQAATAQYLRQINMDRDPIIMDIIASTQTPFVFPWLLSLGLLDNLVDGLLRGAPLMRRTDKFDGDGNILFLPTEEGEDAGLFRLD